MLTPGQDRTCPACGRIGWVAYTRAVTWPTVQGGDVGEPEIVGVPVEFDCPVCRLHLGQDLLSEFPSLRDVVTLDDEESLSEPDVELFPLLEPYFDGDGSAGAD
jgi:hypothetical protein